MTTRMTTPRGSASPPQQSGREQTVSYADLMKPDEDWRNLPNAADRRKIQNRLAQRAYRRSLRERNEEIKRLKRQLEETQAQKQVGSPSTEAETNAGSQVSSPRTTAQQETAHSTPAVIPASEWMGDYLSVWPPTPEPEQHAFMGFTDHHMDALARNSHFSLRPGPGPDSRHAGPTPHALPPHHHAEAPNNISRPYPPMPLSPAPSHYTWDHPMEKCEPTVMQSMSPRPMPPTLNTNLQNRPNFSPSFNPGNRGGDNVSHHHGSNPNHTSSYSIDPMLSMESSSYTELCHTAPPSQSGSGCGSCCCKGGERVSSPPPNFPGQSSARRAYQNAVMPPADGNGMQVQQRPFQGVVVEPSDGGDTLTIRLQHSAGYCRAGAIKLVIQCDAHTPHDSRGGRSSPNPNPSVPCHHMHS